MHDKGKFDLSDENALELEIVVTGSRGQGATTARTLRGTVAPRGTLFPRKGESRNRFAERVRQSVEANRTGGTRRVAGKPAAAGRTTRRAG